MKEFISFIDFTNLSDEEKYKLLNSKDYEIERLNKSFDNLEQVIRYYVLGNSKYDDVTSEYILNRLLQFRTKGSDKE